MSFADRLGAACDEKGFGVYVVLRLRGHTTS